MESRFGYDFSGVRIHADAKAANSAKALHAFAYTVGTNVVFGERQYAPDTDTGRQLLTHELAHVVQQSKIPSTLHKANSLSQPSDAAEIEADAVAAKITKNFAVFGKSEANSQYQSSLSEGIAQGVYSPASPGVIYRRSWPWPFNGYVINNSDEPVTVWSDGRGLYTIAPGDSSGYFTEDVDHIMDRWGVWYKIGANTVTVDENGTVTGYKCVVFGPGDDCPPDIEGSHGDFPVPPGDTGFA